MKGKVNKRITRPLWCYDRKCKVIYSVFEKESHKKGCSSFCYGALPETHTFKHNKVVHKNNLCHCYYTPLKGAIRFLTNEDDLWGELNAKIAVLNRRLKIKCQKCGKKGMYKVVRHECPTCEKKAGD